MSQWITLEKLMSEYGITREEALYWTSLEGIIHSEINGLILVDNDSIFSYLDANKSCADAIDTNIARLKMIRQREIQEELIENQQEICNTYSETIERLKQLLKLKPMG